MYAFLEALTVGSRMCNQTQREELQADLSRARKGKPPLKDADGKTKRNLSSEA